MVFRQIWNERPAILNNPIILRELIVQLRKPYSFAELGLFLTAMAAFMVYIWHGMRNLPATLDFSEEGRSTFYFFNILQGVILLLIIPTYSATKINLELQRNTWEMLISSPCTLASILWGKLLSSILYIWLLLAALIPIYSISMTLGGVSPGEVAFLFVLLTESTVIMALLGLANSIRYRKPATAVTMTYILGIGYFLLLPLSGLMKVALFETFRWTSTPFLFGLPFFTSPFVMAYHYYFIPIPSQPFFIHPWCLSYPLLSHFMATGFMVLILLAWIGWLAYRMRERDERLFRSFLRKMTQRNELSRRCSTGIHDADWIPDRRNPVAIKDLRDTQGAFRLRKFVSLSGLFLAGILIMGIQFNPRPFHFELTWKEWMPLLIVWIFPFFSIAYSAGSLRMEHDKDTWDLLRTTALTPARILLGKWLAGYTLFLWRFGAFYGLPFVIGVVTTGLVYFPHWRESRSIYPRPLEFVVGSCLLMLISAAFYTALGIYLSNRIQNTVRAFLSCFIFLIILLSGFGVLAPFFGRPGILFWETTGHLFSPLILCIKYSIEFQGSAWWTAILIQSMWMGVLSLILWIRATKRIERKGYLE